MVKLQFQDMWLDEGNNHYYNVWNKKNELLGYISFDRQWKKWIWKQEGDVQMAEGCLRQITNKMAELEGTQSHGKVKA